MYSPQTKPTTGRRTSSIAKDTTETTKRQIVTESKMAAGSPSQKIHRPVPIPVRKQEISNSSFEQRPKSKLGYDGEFAKPAIKERRIVSNRPRNDVKRFDIASSESSSMLIGSINSGLDPWSATSASSQDVEPTFAKAGFQSPKSILRKVKYNNQRKVTPISSGQSIDYQSSDKESQIIEEESAPVRVMSDDVMKYTDLEGLCCQVIESDDDSDEQTWMEARLGRRQGDVSPAGSKKSATSQKSNESNRMKNRTSDGKVTPNQRRISIGSEQRSDGEKGRGFHKVIPQLKKRQKTSVQSYPEQTDSLVKSSDSFVSIGRKNVEGFGLTSRLAKSLENLKRFEDACESDCKPSVSNEMLQIREKFFIDLNNELERYIDYPASVFENAKNRYRKMIGWLKFVADNELPLNGEEFTKRFAEYCAEIEEFRRESENISTELREFSSYCLMLVTSLLNKVEGQKENVKTLKLKYKNAAGKKMKLDKITVKLYQKNEELLTEQRAIDQKLGQVHDAAKHQEGTITHLQKELIHIESGYMSVVKAHSKMREEVTNISKKISNKGRESRKKLLEHDKIINDSENTIANLKAENVNIHETFATKLFLSKSRQDELMKVIAGLEENINKLNSELDKAEKSRSDLEKELRECTGYIKKEESVMTTLINLTDPKFRHPYPLLGHTPTEKEMREWTELQETKGELKRFKREAKLRQEKEAEERETRGDLEKEKDRLRQKLKEKDQEVEESRKLREELEKKIEEDREEMEKLQLKVEEMHDGPRLAEALSDRYDLRNRVKELTSKHRELLVQAELTEAAIIAKTLEVEQRDLSMVEECRATEARDELVALLFNKRRRSHGDGSEVVEIVDTESRFHAHNQMMDDMATRKNEMKQRIAESEEKDKHIREMQQRLQNKQEERMKLQQNVADLEVKLREQDLDRLP